LIIGFVDAFAALVLDCIAAPSALRSSSWLRSTL
jgi:hypothetical protein